MALSAVEARNAKAREKAYKLADGGGLYLEVFPHGSKLWRLKYRRPGGRETRVSLGAYPSVSLADARMQRDRLKKHRIDGIDPAEHKRAAKAKASTAAENTFEALALEWHAKQVGKWSAGNAAKLLAFLKLDVFPWLGHRPIGEIEAPELLAVLRRVEGRGAIDKAHRVHQMCGQVFRYAVATGRAARDPSADLRGALTPSRTTHRASVTDPKEVGALLRTIHEYSGSFVVACAMRIAPLLFVRPGELRQAEWCEFDLDAAEWRIPASRMKMKTQHIVPLSAQAVAILRELHPLTGNRQHVFPGERGARRPLSENTLNAALRRMGYAKDQMTAHGFRSIASTLLHELGWNHQVIERQLAHAERNAVSAAYNFAEHLPERRRMMQAWADYLNALRDQSNVVAGNFGRAA